MPYCNNCGKRVNKNVNFCSECGAFVEKKSRNKNMLALTIFIALIAITAFAAISIFSGKSTTKPGAIKPVTYKKVIGSKYEDTAYSVKQTKDGNYALVGIKNRGADDTILGTSCLIKFTPKSKIAWSRTYSLDKASQFHPQCFIQNKNREYILPSSGLISDLGLKKASLIKTNYEGKNPQFHVYEEGREIYSIKQASNGGYVMAGAQTKEHRHWEGWFVKLDDNLKKIWSHTFDLGYFKEVERTKNGGYILIGNDNGTAVIMKTGVNGEKIWSRSMKSSKFTSVLQARDGGYLVTVKDGSSNMLVKFTSDGSFAWSSNLGSNSHVNDMCRAEDEGYILAGKKEINNNQITTNKQYTARIMKTTEKGQVTWSHNFKFNGQISSKVNSIIQAEDSGYLLTGKLRSPGDKGDIFLIKTNENGKVRSDN